MTIRKLWLIFAQAATVALAALFVLTTLKPEWAPGREAPREAPVVRTEVAPVSAPAPAPVPGARPRSYHDAVVKAAPAVVNIFTSGTARGARNPFADDPLFRRFFGDPPGGGRPTSSLGSGVIVSAKGYVLTNNHVVEGMDQIEVLLADSKTRLRAKLVGSDPETDLAVLKLEREDLPAIALGSLDGVRVGDVVLAIGNPFGVGQTVTMGIVSALGRTGLGVSTYENFIQTDAAINQGNSGGALVDTAGSLIGINTVILSGSGGSIGIGFAIPVSTARTVMEQIIAEGSVTRGYIGIQAQEVTPELAESFKIPGGAGVLIAGVERGGPSDKGGVRPGDVLIAVNGRPTRDPAAMLDAVAALGPGTQATLKLRRSQGELDVVVTVGKRPPAQRRPPPR
jgi:Do/DeqQ family serine protease